jgi:Mg/Co/Ni transporter MgtE
MPTGTSTEELSFAFLEAHPVDAARVLERLLPRATAMLLASAPVRLTAPVLRQMLPLNAARVIEALDDSIASALLRSMGPQAGVALLRHLSEARRNQLLEPLPAAIAIAFRLLLGYPEDAVGAWMDPRVLAMPADARVSEATRRVGLSEEGAVEDVYVVGKDQRLRGVVGVVDLLRADTLAVLRQIMRPPTDTLPAQALLAKAQDHRGWNWHRALPVVERGERFVGALRYATLRQALSREAPRQAERAADDAVSALAGAYWYCISGLTEAIVAMLPASRPDKKNEPLV